MVEYLEKNYQGPANFKLIKAVVTDLHEKLKQLQNNENAKILNEIAINNLKLGQFENAKMYALKSLAIEPNNVTAKNTLKQAAKLL